MSADFDPAIRDTLFTALLKAAARFGGRSDQWVDSAPGRYSYARVVRMTLALGRLACKVTREGESVGVLLPNRVTTLALLIGLSAFRRVPCMLNYTAGAEGMQGACRTAGIRTILTSRLFLDKAGLAGPVARLRDVRLLCLEDLRAGFGWRDWWWLLFQARWRPRAVVPPQDPEAAAVVLFTSGSEGQPKGVVLSHRALLANVAQIQQLLPFGPAETVLAVLPVFHSFGLTAGVLIPLVTGSRLVLYTSPLHYKTIPEWAREHRCTVLFASGTFLGQYARHAGPEDFASLRLVVAGAEKLAEPVREVWRQRFGIDILEGYGTTELAPVVSVNLPGANRPGTVGPLIPGVEARLVPVPGIESGGALHLRGPNLMSGYLLPAGPGHLVPPASSLGPGWHDTGDVASLDADGYLRIVGRLKRFAKVAGEMVALELSEAIAQAASPEARHAAVVRPDSERGERIVLFSTDPALGREVLVAAARHLGLPEIAVPREVELVDNLPLLGSGKIDYSALK